MDIKIKKIIDKNPGLDFLKNNEMLLISKQNFKIIEEKKRKRKNFLKCLENISKIFKNQSGWSIIKIKEIPKAHSDVDILIDSNKFGVFKKILLENGYELTKNYDNTDFNFYKKEFDLIIDIQKGDYHTSLMHINYVGEKNILKNSKIKILNKIRFPYPSNEDNFLIFCAHSIFSNDTTQKYKGNSTFNLSDIYQLYFDSNKKDFDWNYIQKISKEYFWEEGIYYAIKIANKFFSSESLKKGEKIIGKDIQKRTKEKIDLYISKRDDLPQIISKNFLLKLCFKKAWKEKSIKSTWAYFKWFFYNKFAVLIKKKFFN